MPSLRSNSRRSGRHSHKRRVVEVNEDDFNSSEGHEELLYDASVVPATHTSVNSYKLLSAKAPPSLASTDTDNEELISSFTPRSSHTRKKSSGDTPRPPNAFICFRMDLCDQSRRMQAELKKQEAQEEQKIDGEDTKKQRKKKQDEREISRMAGQIWQTMTKDQRTVYHVLQDILKERHAKEFPEYKYSPVHNKCALTKSKKPKVEEARIVRWKMLVQYTIRNKNAYVEEDNRVNGIASIIASALRSVPTSRRPKAHTSRQQQRRKSSASQPKAEQVRKPTMSQPEEELQAAPELHKSPPKPEPVEVQIPQPIVQEFALEDGVTTPDFSFAAPPQLLIPHDSLLWSFKYHAWPYAAKLSLPIIDRYHKLMPPGIVLQSTIARPLESSNDRSTYPPVESYFGHGMSVPLSGSETSLFRLTDAPGSGSSEDDSPAQVPLSEMSFAQWIAYTDSE